MAKAIVTVIKAISRASVKIGDSFYTLEYGEERTVPEDADLTEERKALWDTCNSEVDLQIEDVLKLMKK